MEYLIDITNTITSYIYSFFVQEEYLHFKKIELTFIDDVNDEEIDNLINTVKKDIEDEKQMVELEIRYENLVREYDDMISKQSFEDNEDENNDSNNDDGKIMIPV
jgi:hypothetical protein